MRQWSYSSLSTYETCPYKYKLNKLDGIEVPFTSPAALRGVKVHEGLERYLNHESDEMPGPASKHFEDEISHLRENEARPELELAFDRDWNLSTWDGAWVRARLDAVVPKLRVVIDFKTGRYYENHRDQAHLYGMLTLKADPEPEDVLVEFWYLDQDFVQSWMFKRSYMKNMERKWMRRYEKLETETEWKPVPGKHCKWCPYRASAGGQCVFDG